jgi:simple sugar transport system permease protein
LTVNIAAAGITDALSVQWFGTKGVLRNPEFIMPLQYHIPIIKDIPLLGSLFSGHVFAVYFSWFIVIAAIFFIRHTHWGLRLVASGRSPEAARERGLRPGLYWEAAWAIAACLAAVAGAFLCFRVGAYTPGGIAGRGWISLAAVFLGFHHAGGVYIAALVFALAEMAGRYVQSIAGLSATALLGLPNALALVLYIVFQGIKKRR